MLQITIIVNDEEKGFRASSTSHSFEGAMEDLGKLERKVEKMKADAAKAEGAIEL